MSIRPKKHFICQQSDFIRNYFERNLASAQKLCYNPFVLSCLKKWVDNDGVK